MVYFVDNDASLFPIRFEKFLVNDKNTALCQTNMSSNALFQTLQTANVNFDKLLGQQVLKNRNCNPFQSSSSLCVLASFCISCVI